MKLTFAPMYYAVEFVFIINKCFNIKYNIKICLHIINFKDSTFHKKLKHLHMFCQDNDIIIRNIKKL